MTKKYSKKTFTTGQLAKILEVTDETIRNWINKGIINVIKLPSGRNQIPVEMVKNLMKQYSIPEDRLFNSPRMKVLLADLDDVARVLFRKYFEGKQEYMIDSVKNSLELGIRITKFKPDVLLIDINFDENMFELLTILQRDGEFEGITIGLIPFNSDDSRGKELEVFDHTLEKPYTFEDLKECIESTLKKNL
ncbi:MAG: hypothetical protein K8S87_00150 [Planctomycetes bacterium]|nr:hypothetical protein [Planctomycetota bacterium]